jgi:putative membrane protein
MKNSLLTLLRGMAMGAADVVPGVSGGTIAFITGIYPLLLQSLSRFDLRLIAIIKKGGFKAGWQHINGGFLLALFSGVGLSILSLARVISYLMEHQPLLLWSFFFGLILASSLYIARQITRWSVFNIVLVLLGVAVAVIISQLRPVEIDAGMGFIFIAGAIAITAMILPGISGSFILLLLGVYGQVLGAVKTFDLTLLLYFLSGCIVGLLSFVKLLNWLLDRFYQPVLSVLMGFVAGSLAMVWPWKHVVSTYTSSSGVEKPLVQRNIMPFEYELLTGQPAQLIGCIALVVVAVIVVLVLERFGDQRTEAGKQSSDFKAG